MSDQPLTKSMHGINLNEQPLANLNIDLEDSIEISQTPIQISKQYISDSQSLANILNSVLVMFVYNYVRDERLREAYFIDDKLHEIMVMADGVPYEIGMYSPQFWYDESGQAKIGHINTRKALKNYLLSCKLSSATSKKSSEKKCLSEFLERYDADETLFIIRDYNDDSIIEELKHYGISVKDVKPTDFDLKDGQLMIDGEIARQFYLDLDREELKSFDKQVLQAIITSGRCINDARTLILVHDMRTLSIMFDQSIMGSYTNIDEYHSLSPYLSPLFRIQTTGDQDLLKNPEYNWLLYKNNPDTDSQVIYKNQTDKEKWEEIITNEWYYYTVGHSITRKKYELKTESKTEKVEINGSDIFYNGKSYGPGLFTAISEDGSATRLIPQIETE